MKQTIINIVSGKGGTGKTLMACVLADMLGNSPESKVIVVDLDFFVRGLTSLLYFHREEKLQIVPVNELTVSNFFLQKLQKNNPKNVSIAIAKYRSFEVVPAVSRIDEHLNFQDIGPDTRDEAASILRYLISKIPPDFRFIILDSRAGYDELIAATHQLSDVSICVEEQDPISRVTADNLVSQLNQDAKTPVFRIINKVRGLTTPDLIQSASRSVTDLGVIPFDMDILNSFGLKDFWDQVSRSLYRWALVSVWNRLSSKLQLGTELNLPRLSPLASESVEARIGMLTTQDRVLAFYGLILAATGIFYGLFGQELFYVFKNDPTRILSLIMGFSGLLVALFAFIRKR
ncbi:MAG: ParA family protein [Chlorobiaceae bacterium]|nr:ParA family protein [Chlorobiaceae bacterium]